MTSQLSRRNFLKLAGASSFALLATLGLAPTMAPQAYAQDPDGETDVDVDPEGQAVVPTYGTDLNTVVTSKTKLSASIKKFTYNKKSCSTGDTQALCIDATHKLFFMLKTNDDGMAAIWMAKMSATKKADWKCVKVMAGNWAGHGNGMTCIPTKKGVRLFVATNSVIRTIYIPNVKVPTKKIATGTWTSKNFKPQAIDYDPSSKLFVVRNGITSNSKGDYYCNCYLFKAPTTKKSGDFLIPSFAARFRIEFPESVAISAGVFGEEEEIFYPRAAGKQNLHYKQGCLYLPVSDTKTNRYSALLTDGSTKYLTNRNVILRYQLTSLSKVISTYKAQGIVTYPVNRTILDNAVTIANQGFEIEDFATYGSTTYMLTNEASETVANKHDWIRTITL